ncbi:SulP family inorganic anion transporter [Halomicroarcula sp. GCM10025709]|uniref:SulP family inorganic anion transporter n=1 Tax=Halomicroarcula sp. GCM10025709 TaxID=3252669 RepID=UPI003613FF8D
MRLPDIGTLLPIVEWLREYEPGWLRADLVAGLTVGAAVVPEGMAYAALAGLPLETGLYASLAAVTAYLVVGTSKQVIVGPTSALAVLLATQVGAVATGGAAYVTLVGVTTLLVGAIAFVAWLFRLGFVMNFISESVLTGFSAGAALFIISTQLPTLLGLDSASGQFYERIWFVLNSLAAIQPLTAAVGVGTVLLLLAGERYAPRLPSALIVVALAIALVTVTGIEEQGVTVVGAVPSGLPVLAVPTTTLSTVVQLLPVALALFILSYVEGMAAVETFAQRHKYRADPDQELLATGLTNTLSGLAQGFVVGGSMSRSALNDAVGGRTQAINAIVAVVLIVVLVFLTGLLSALPEATLAGVVIVAVTKLVDVAELRRLWRVDRGSFSQPQWRLRVCSSWASSMACSSGSSSLHWSYQAERRIHTPQNSDETPREASSPTLTGIPPTSECPGYSSTVSTRSCSSQTHPRYDTICWSALTSATSKSGS